MFYTNNYVIISSVINNTTCKGGYNMLEVKSAVLSKLPMGEWTLVKNTGEMYASHFLIKYEEDKVTIVNLTDISTTPKYLAEGVAHVIHDGIFMEDPHFAKFSLRNISLQDLIYTVIQNESDNPNGNLIFDLLYNPESLEGIEDKDSLKNLRSLVYTQDVSDELLAVVDDLPLIVEVQA